MNAHELDPDEMLTPADVCRLLKVGGTTLSNWRATGQGPAWFRIGARDIRYRRSDLRAWVDRGRGAWAGERR